MRTTELELKGEFEVTGWDEKPYHEGGGEKLTRERHTEVLRRHRR